MRKSFAKRVLAYILAGTMVAGSAVTVSAADPATDAQDTGNVSRELVFGTTAGAELTAETVREPIFETDDDGHDGFNGAFNFQHSEGAFNMAGHYPMLITFDVKLGDTANGEYQIIGKMDNDYGIQIGRNAESDYVQAYYNNTENGNRWPTYKIGGLDLDDWTTITVMFDGYNFWLSTTGGEGLAIPSDGKDAGRGSALQDTPNQRFAIGYNFSKGTGTAIPNSIFYDNVKMYRLSDQAEAGLESTDTTGAASLAEQLMATDPIFSADVQVTTDESKLVAVETEFWNEQVKAGTMAQQTDNDEWLYQVKENGVWENIGSDYFYPNYTPDNEELGTGSWMQADRGSSTNFHYSKLTASQITCTFADSSAYTEVAYVWRVQEDGYYRATLVNPIGNSDGIPLVVSHSSSDELDTIGTILLDGDYNAGGTFTSRIAKASAGDLIRIGSDGSNKWATGFEPAIEEVTVKEYAQQYLGDLAEVSTEGKTESSAAAYNEAKAALEGLLENTEATDEAVEAALTTLEGAVAGLENLADYSAVTEAQEAAAALEAEDYTEASWSAVQEALESVIEGLGASAQEQVNGYAEAINNAIDALVAKYVVTVDGEVVAKGEFDDYITITLSDAVKAENTGKVFAGWMMNGNENVISTEETYSFYLTADTTFVSKFVETEEEVTQDVSAALTNVNITERDDGKHNVQFVGQLTLPEGYRLQQAGLLWGRNTSYEDSLIDENEIFKDGVKATVAKTVSGTYQFSITINGVPAGNKIQGSIYVIAYGADGTRVLEVSPIRDVNID